MPGVRGLGGWSDPLAPACRYWKCRIGSYLNSCISHLQRILSIPQLNTESHFICPYPDIWESSEKTDQSNQIRVTVTKTLKCSQGCLTDMFSPSWGSIYVLWKPKATQGNPSVLYLPDFLWKSCPVPGRGSPSEFCTQPGPFCAFPHCRGSGNQPECWEKPILCEIHRIWDKIQLCSGKDHILAIHKTHKKPNHKYLHPCLREPKPLAVA